MNQETKFLELTATEAYKIHVQIKQLSDKHSALMELLKVDAGGIDKVWGNYKLSISLRPGSIEYSSIPQIQSVDLEQYRKSPIKVCKLEFLGE